MPHQTHEESYPNMFWMCLAQFGSIFVYLLIVTLPLILDLVLACTVFIPRHLYFE